MAKLSEAQRKAAMAAGKFAGERKKPVTDCPYEVAGIPLQRALANAWMREYLRANLDAVKGVDLT